MITALLALTLQQKIEAAERLLVGITDNTETVRVHYKITDVEDKVTRECISKRLSPLEYLLKISSSLRDEIKRSTEEEITQVDRDLRKLEIARQKSFELREQALMCRFGLAKGDVTVKMIQTDMEMVDEPSNSPDIYVPEASPN